MWTFSNLHSDSPLLFISIWSVQVAPYAVRYLTCLCVMRDIRVSSLIGSVALSLSFEFQRDWGLVTTARSAQGVASSRIASLNCLVVLVGTAGGFRPTLSAAVLTHVIAPKVLSHIKNLLLNVGTRLYDN